MVDSFHTAVWTFWDFSSFELEVFDVRYGSDLRAGETIWLYRHEREGLLNAG